MNDKQLLLTCVHLSRHAEYREKSWAYADINLLLLASAAVMAAACQST